MPTTTAPIDADSPAVDIDIVTPEWRTAIADVETACLTAVAAAWHAADTPLARALAVHPTEVSVRLTDDDEVAALNSDYRQRPTPTNVLSFAGVSPDEATALPPGVPVLLGDVVLAFGVLRAEAEAEGKTLNDHFSHLVVHGTLHLLGYDHIDDGDAVIMERLETDVLARLGVADPCSNPQADVFARTGAAQDA